MLEHRVWARKCHREFLLHVTILVQAANIFMSERFIRRTMVEMNSSMSLTSGRKIPEMLIGIPTSPLSRLHQRVSLMLLMSKKQEQEQKQRGCWILMVGDPGCLEACVRAETDEHSGRIAQRPKSAYALQACWAYMLALSNCRNTL